LGTLSSGAGYAGPSAVSNHGRSSESQSNYSASSTNYPSTHLPTYISSSSPSNAYNPTSTSYSITPHSTSSSASVHNTPAPGPMLPRPLYSYGSSWEWDSQSGESTDEEQASIPALLASFSLNDLIVIDPTAFHIDTMLLGELLHTYLMLVPSLPSLLLMSLLCRARFICIPLRSNFH
ncbi:hypothetical protein B0H13DRAFT_2047362, partial [Mycena leptocephala]